MRKRRLWDKVAEMTVITGENDAGCQAVMREIYKYEENKLNKSIKKHRTTITSKFVQTFVCICLSVIFMFGIMFNFISDTDNPILPEEHFKTQELEQILLDAKDVSKLYEKNLYITSFNFQRINLFQTRNEKPVPVYFEIRYTQIEITPLDFANFSLIIFLVKSYDFGDREQVFNNDKLKNNVVYKTADGDISVDYNDSSKQVNPDPDDIDERKLFAKFKHGKNTYYIEGSYTRVPEMWQEIISDEFPGAVFIDNLLDKLLNDLFGN